MYFVLLAVSIAFCVACDIYDVTMTQKGLKAGVAIEGNTWLVGEKPSAKALYLRDSLLMLFCITPSLLLSFVNPPAAFGTLSGPIAYGVKHILGGRAWVKLLRKK